MTSRKLIKVVSVNNYTSIHPALDFWENKAIVAVGGKWEFTYDRDGTTEVEFKSIPTCVCSDGDSFLYSKKALSERQLYHTGSLDIPVARWGNKDVEDFCGKPQARLFTEIHSVVKDAFLHYMDFIDTRLYELLPCFVIYTYFYPLFNHAPVVQLWGEFKTGKTKILSLLEAMAFNPINSANISSASVFRLVESRRATLLLDESEDLMTTDRAKEIRNMFLAGTGKSGETYRQEKSPNSESYTTQSFRVFSPKVIANIAGIDIPALQSRVIRVVTVGAADKAKENREVDQEHSKWQEVRNELYRLCLIRYKDIIRLKEELPDCKLSGRPLCLWQGILTVASAVGSAVLASVVNYAQENKEIIEDEIEEETLKPRRVLEELLRLVTESNEEYYSVDTLLSILSQDVPLNSKRDLGILLARLGIKSRVLRRDGHCGRFYELSRSQLLVLQKHR